MCSRSAPGCRQKHGEEASRRFGSKAPSPSKLKCRCTLHEYVYKQGPVKYAEAPNKCKHIILQIPIPVTQPMHASTSLSKGIFLENHAIISHR